MRLVTEDFEIYGNDYCVDSLTFSANRIYSILGLMAARRLGRSKQHFQYIGECRS